MSLWALEVAHCKTFDFSLLASRLFCRLAMANMVQPNQPSESPPCSWALWRILRWGITGIDRFWVVLKCGKGWCHWKNGFVGTSVTMSEHRSGKSDRSEAMFFFARTIRILFANFLEGSNQRFYLGLPTSNDRFDTPSMSVDVIHHSVYCGRRLNSDWVASSKKTHWIVDWKFL